MADPWPQVLVYEDITVVPMAEMFQGPRETTKGGPVWPDWDAQPRSRHYRDGLTADVRPEDAAPEATIDDGRPYFWIGAIVDHFGHFLAEFATRILPTITACPEAVLVFTGHVDYPFLKYERSPPFVKALLAWYDVPEERVLVVDRPTRFRKLSVVPEPEVLGEQFPGDPCPAYLAALDAWVAHKLGPRERRGTVFVTRSGQAYRFGGEGALDAAFRAWGAEVVRPETLSLPGQVAAYAGAETLVFSEGSAIHGLQLLGSLGRVIILARRPGMRIAEWKLRPRARSLAYVDASQSIVAGLFPADNGMRGSIDLARSYSVLNTEATLGGLAVQGMDLRPHWDEAAFRATEAADLDAFRDQMWTSVRHNPASLRPLLKGLRICGVRGARAHGRWLVARQAEAQGWRGTAGAVRRRAWLGYYEAAAALSVLGPAVRAVKKLRA